APALPGSVPTATPHPMLRCTARSPPRENDPSPSSCDCHALDERKGVRPLFSQGGHKKRGRTPFSVSTPSSRATGRRELPMEVVVSGSEPVLTDRTEDVELEGVFQRFGLVLHPRRDVQHFTL